MDYKRVFWNKKRSAQIRQTVLLLRNKAPIQNYFKSRLLQNLGNNAGTDRSAAFTDSETETFFNSDGLNNDNFHVDIIAGHNHFNALGKLDSARNVGGSDEELRSVMIEECSMTALFPRF